MAGAGGWAAKTLRDEGFSGEICVVAEEQWDFYERPPLSKAALLEAEPALPRLFSAEVQQALDLRWYRPLRAKSIDRQNKTLALSNGETLAYDLLLIATGGRARLPSEALGAASSGIYPAPLAGRAASEAAVGIGNAAGDRRRRLDWPRNRRLGAQKRRSRDPYEQQPALCMRSVSMEVSQALDELHRGQGVDIRRGCGALELEDDNGLPTLHCDGQRETFDAVVVGIGVDLNLELARDAGLTVDRGIVVNAQGRSNDPAIFAAGDVAQHHQYGLCIQSWAFAQNQAIATAKAMLDPQASGYDEAPWLWSDQYDRNVQILGIPQAGSRTIVRDEPQGAIYFSLNADGRLTQLVAFNNARIVKLAKRWMAAGRDLSNVPLADPTFSLMSLR